MTLDQNDKLSYDRIVAIKMNYDSKMNGLAEKYENQHTLQKNRNKRKIIIILFVCIIFTGLVTYLFGHLVLSHEVQGLYTVCYTTNTGECYHAAGCRYLKSSHKTNVYDAKKSGYRSCSRCSVGPLDNSLKNEYGWGFLIAVIPSCIAFYYFSIKILRRKDDEIDRQKANDENNLKLAIKYELSGVNEYNILSIAGVPNDVKYDNGLPLSEDKRFIVYVSTNGNCYHMNKTCRNNWLLPKHAFLCTNYQPCSFCASKITIPEWHKKYLFLLSIVMTFQLE